MLCISGSMSDMTTADPFLGDLSKFKKKYRIPSTRLKDWDYSSPGLYFVTICTKGRLHWFGEIKDGEMELSEAGKIVQEFWEDIPSHFLHATLEDFIVMPNHIHGILMFRRPVVETRDSRNKDRSLVETRHVASLQKNVFGPLKKGSLQKVIQAFKAASTRSCHMHGLDDFQWQSRFHEHIIRSQKELQNARSYIQSNPSTWIDDPDRDYSILTF